MAAPFGLPRGDDAMIAAEVPGCSRNMTAAGPRETLRPNDPTLEERDSATPRGCALMIDLLPFRVGARPPGVGDDR